MEKANKNFISYCHVFLADYKIYNLTVKYGILVCCYAIIIVKFKF